MIYVCTSQYPLDLERVSGFSPVTTDTIPESYLLKEGSRWRSLPHDSNWQSVYYHYNHWRNHVDKASGLPLLELVLKKTVAVDRLANGRLEATTFLIIDAQSVKNTDPAESKRYDAGKKTSDIKRNLAVDSRGPPHLLQRNHRQWQQQGRSEGNAAHGRAALRKVGAVLVDTGYDGRPTTEFVEQNLGATVKVARRSQLHTFAVIPKSWVAERTISGWRSAAASGRTASANSSLLWL